MADDDANTQTLGFGFRRVTIRQHQWLAFLRYYGVGNEDAVSDGDDYRKWRLDGIVITVAHPMTMEDKDHLHTFVRIDGFVRARDEAWERLTAMAEFVEAPDTAP